MQASTFASTSRDLGPKAAPRTTAAHRGRGETGMKDKRPKVLIMGPRSGGKSSIRKVVFEKMAPTDTLFIDKSSKASDDEDFNAFVSIAIWDLPGGELAPDTWPIAFDQLSAVIFVLDGQSPTHDIIRKLAVTMDKAFMANRAIQFEIFLHKIDGFGEDFRLDMLQTLRDRLTDELFDMSPELESTMNVFYHLTSVFDTSIYEALSKVIQKLIPEQAMLERLLDLLCQQCSMDKAFLFDTSSKIYIATDSAPLENQVYVICSDYIDLVGDLSLLYEPSSTHPTPHPRSASFGSRSATLSPPLRPLRTISLSTSTSGSSTPTAVSEPLRDPEREPEARLPRSVVRLGTGGSIAQWGVNRDLSLVAFIRPNMMDQHSALIEYNVSIFRKAVLDIFERSGGGQHLEI